MIKSKFTASSFSLQPSIAAQDLGGEERIKHSTNNLFFQQDGWTPTRLSKQRRNLGGHQN